MSRKMSRVTFLIVMLWTLEEVEGRRGIKNTVVLQHHIFNSCKMYPWSNAYPRE